MNNFVATFFKIFVILLPISIFSQEMPNVVPPSPEASSLGKFTEVPISHYTGLPNISIPIYTINQDGVSIPIGLSYHARGVKVSDIAPRTGMGWSLQYGGSISRQVRGKADEHPTNGYLSNKFDFINYSLSQETRSLVNNKETNDPGYDRYPDQFNFSAGGISGKFILDYRTGEPIVQSFDDVKVTYTRTGSGEFSGAIKAFVITDAQGNKYYFGESKNVPNVVKRYGQDYQTSGGFSIYHESNPLGVVSDPAGSGTFLAYSSWKLMDIETVNGSYINYYYENSATSDYFRKSYDKHDASSEGGITNSLTNIGNISKIHTRLSQIVSYEKQLSKIVFNNGRDKIIFENSQDVRDDFDGYALDKIEIYNKDNFIKSFKLNYHYTQSTDQSNLLWYFTNLSNSNFVKSFSRMFLSSIQEEFPDTENPQIRRSLPPHEFVYDDQKLPSTFSSRQDYWGYYNGAENNGPFTRLFNYGTYVPDRRVNVAKSEAGILKEINYPTGGKAKFTYEQNKGFLPSEFNDLVIPKVNPKLKIELTREDFSYQSGTYAPYQLQLPSNTNLTFKINCTSITQEGNLFPVNCFFNFRINNNLVNIGEDINFNTQFQGTNFILTIEPAVDASIPPNAHREDYARFTINMEYDGHNIGELYGPGKRIKKIENITETGEVLTKEYEYVYTTYDSATDTYNSRPIGAIIGLPGYVNTVDHPDYGIMHIYLNDTGSSFSSFQPNAIGYSNVIEYQGTKANNIGKTEYTFTNLSDSGDSYYNFPYHPPTDNEWLRGKNIETKIYKKNQGQGYTLVKEIFNKYLYGGSEYDDDLQYTGLININFPFTPQAILLDWDTNFVDGGVFNDIPAGYYKDRTFFKLPLFIRQSIPFNDPNFNVVTDLSGYRIYNLIGGTQHLLRTTEKDYLDNGTLEKQTTYSYNYDRHYKASQVSTVTSDGDAMIQQFTYPQDFVIQDIESQDPLVQQHRFVPIEVRSYRDIDNNGVADANELLNTTETVYQWYNLPGEETTDIENNDRPIYAPSIIKTGKGVNSNNMENRIEFKDYDSDGNILVVSKTDGNDIIYIYGYNNTLPIAKIENATLNQVESLAHGVRNASNGDDSSCTINENCSENALRTAQTNLRNGLQKAMVTTYTYDPLIGVTSMTDPRGNTVYYEYDDFNRLLQVKDFEGNILSKNKYNYGSQN